MTATHDSGGDESPTAELHLRAARIMSRAPAERRVARGARIPPAMLPREAGGALEIWGHLAAYLEDELVASAVLAPPGLLIGRGPHCDVRLEEPTVSWDHVELGCRGRTVIAEDLGSSNGTWLNGQPIDRPRRLRSGDVLQLGRVRLSVNVRGAEGSRTTQTKADEICLTEEERELAAALVVSYRSSTSLVGRPATRAELAEALNTSQRTAQRRLDALVARLRIPPHTGRERSLLLAQRILELGLDAQR